MGSASNKTQTPVVVEMWFPFCLTPEGDRRNGTMATMNTAWAVERA